MGKYEKKKKKKHYKSFAIAAILFLLAGVLVIFVMPRILYEMNDSEETVEANNTSAQRESIGKETDPAEVDKDSEATSEMMNQSLLEFPLLLENGKLEIESIFQFDGINPDSNNQEGNNIATVMITNLSDTYLESAELFITTDRGDVLNFVVTNLPAGKTALAFSTENTAVNTSAAYTDVTCSSVFDAEASINDDRITVMVDGTKVNLKNKTSEEITNVVVYCHASLGDQFFGGITYTYTINNLSANGTAEIDAMDCFLGLAEVVRIAISE